MAAIIWLVHNRTDNVFEEIYYSEYPSVIRNGMITASVKNIKGWNRSERSLEKDLGGNIKIYGFAIKTVEKVWGEIEKGERILFGSTIEENNSALCFFYEYRLKEKKLYVNCYFREDSAEEIKSGLPMNLETFLKRQGMNTATIEELRDNVLKEIIEKWYEGNKGSKFNAEDWGKFEIVYE